MKKVIKKVVFGVILYFMFCAISLVSFASEREHKYGTLPPQSVQTRIEQGEYQIVQSRTTGIWKQGTNGHWWYEHADGSYTTDDWEFIGDKWYYFDTEGYSEQVLGSYKIMFERAE